MSEVTIAMALGLAFVIILLWFLRPRRHSRESGKPFNNVPIENMLPRHYRYFPQVRQALSAMDEEHLRKVAVPPVARRALRERRAVAHQFVAGLREDFLNLNRLARMVAALSPVISREQETERLILAVKFHCLYALVWLRLSTGVVPLRQIEHLTGLIGSFAMRMERAMAAISTIAGDRATSELSA